MLVQKKSTFSGQINEMELPITEADLIRWQNGELIQDVFPHLTPDEREFLMNGVTPEEWNVVFGD